MTYLRPRPLWAFVGLFAFLTFPALGSAWAHPDGNRRLAQAAVLSISVALLLPSLARFRLPRRQLGWTVLLAALPLLPSVFRGAGSPSSVTGYAVSLLLVGWLWTGLGLLAIGVGRGLKAGAEDPPGQTCSLLVTVLGVGIVLKTWWVGVLTADVFVTFGGHTNSVATLGLLGLCWTSFVSPWKHLVLAAPAYAYLLVLSTSRAGFVAFGLAWVALAGHAAVGYRRDRNRAGLRRACVRLMIMPASCLAVILPMLLGPSPLYPYRSIDRPDLVVQHYADFWGRMSRFARLLPAGRREALFAGLKGLHESAGNHVGAEALQLLTERSVQPENRLFLVKEAWAEATVGVLGRWPVPYSSQGLAYPHNHALDMAHNFGWLPSMVSQLALLIAILFSWAVLATGPPKPYVALVFLGVLVSAVKVQFAGDLIDSVPLMLVCVIALALERPTGPSIATSWHLFKWRVGRGVS